LSILLVVYLGLFAILNNDGLHQFLIRWSHTIKRVVLGSIMVAMVVGVIIALNARNNAAVSRAKQQEEIIAKKASLVKPSDLRKIVLFDAGSKYYTYSPGSIEGVYGRIRNELPMPVERITLKISVYSDHEKGKLLEVRTLSLNSTNR